MKYEIVRDLQIPKIGFGTYGIGGGGSADPSRDAESMQALRSALELGYVHFDTAEVYAGGHAEDLIGRVLRETGTPREKVFLTSKVDPAHLAADDVLQACEGSLKRLGTDYLDLYLIHWPNRQIPLKDTFRGMNKLVREGRVRHAGVSNFNLKLLQQAQAECETPLLTNQVPYSLPENTYVKNGVLEYCQQNDILVTAYTPVKFRDLNVNKAIRAIAEAHSATPFQIALAWLVAQPRVITIPKAADRKHQEDNLRAAEIELSRAEMDQLNGLYNR